mmetsp:Transcript_2959/g.5661  ORF Transcript_2959/g.5661 Transcript_2959/m.5661 type:complete len:532 (-) Transcript_2959:308-1903(-)
MGNVALGGSGRGTNSVTAPSTASATLKEAVANKHATITGAAYGRQQTEEQHRNAKQAFSVAQQPQQGSPTRQTQRQQQLLNGDADNNGFVRRKGGKRPPKDPSMSVEERLAKAALQAQQTARAHSGEPEGDVLAEDRFADANELVKLVNRVSVPVTERPSRRLRPKAPSSSCSPVNGSDSSEASISSGEAAREPVSLRTFEVLKLLGKGSHGKVFLVRHRGTKEVFAMKQMKKSDVINSKQLENTKREFKVHVMLACQEAQCPNITPLRYAFHTRSRLYLVFDFCSGGELYYHIGQRGRLPEALARFFGAQVALALGYLHSNGIAYRDLKPENLLLDADGNIQLVDLGLCKDGMRSATTGSSSFCGTTEYLAPEILSYQEHGLAVDWWSYGMVLYEMLTGLPPWYSYEQENVIQNILRADLEFPSYVSDAAKDLITKLLCRDPAARLGSMDDVEELISHPFFEEIDWVALARNEVQPPFVPPSNGDLVCNFDTEFTEASVEVERDSFPSPSNDPFGRFYFDCEDPVNASPC